MKKVSFFKNNSHFYKVAGSDVSEVCTLQHSPSVGKSIDWSVLNYVKHEPATEDEYEAARAEVLNQLGLVDACAEHEYQIRWYEEQESNRFACEGHAVSDLPF